MRIISKFGELVKERRKQNKERFLLFCEYYNNCIEMRRDDFENMKRQLEQILEQLLREGKISNKCKILSRIKSPASAAEKILNKEGAYDIFGVTILTNTEEELAVIEGRLAGLDFKTKYERHYERAGGRDYKAMHYQFFSGEKSKKTVVECHLQTEKSYNDNYPHAFYKATKKLAGQDIDREATEARIIDEVREQYKSGKLCGVVLSNGKRSAMPEMWETSFNKAGKMCERKLDEKETLRVVYYPCLEGFDMEVLEEVR